MGQKTGAFETVVSRDPAVFKPESLRQFDAVFFNNTVGNLFTDPALRQSLVEFVYGGGGLMGVHGTSVAFTHWPGACEDWPEFGLMIGARGANHRASDEHVFVKLDDPAHPLNQPFGGQGFEFRDEFFRVHEPYSRDRVRVLLSIDTQKTDLKPEPGLRQAGPRGQRLRAGLGAELRPGPGVLLHDRPQPVRLLGSEDAAVLPGGRRSSPWATCPRRRSRAQTDAGHPRAGEARLAAGRSRPTRSTSSRFFEAIDKTAQLGLPYMGGLSFQKVSRGDPKNFDPQLTDDELQADPAEARLRRACGC